MPPEWEQGQSISKRGLLTDRVILSRKHLSEVNAIEQMSKENGHHNNLSTVGLLCFVNKRDVIFGFFPVLLNHGIAVTIGLFLPTSQGLLQITLGQTHAILDIQPLLILSLLLTNCYGLVHQKCHCLTLTL